MDEEFLSERFVSDCCEPLQFVTRETITRATYFHLQPARIRAAFPLLGDFPLPFPFPFPVSGKAGVTSTMSTSSSDESGTSAGPASFFFASSFSARNFFQTIDSSVISSAIRSRIPAVFASSQYSRRTSFVVLLFVVCEALSHDILVVQKKTYSYDAAVFFRIIDKCLSEVQEVESTITKVRLHRYLVEH